MSFIQPIPCSSGGGGEGTCCPHIFTGYCLNDGTPIAITIVNGVQTTWTNLLTGVVTPGPPPVGTGVCTPDIEVVIQPLDCDKDSVTICPGDDPIIITGAVTQGTSPWIIGDGGSSITVDAVNLDIRDLVFATDKVDVSGSFVTVDVANASTSSVPAQTITGVAAVVLAANPLRRSFTIQNTGVVPVYITFGAIAPTATAYHFALSPGIVSDDGKGVFFVDDQWAGTVQAFSSSPGSIVVMEVT